MLTVVGEAEPLGDENEGQCELKRERADVDCARQGGRGGKDVVARSTSTASRRGNIYQSVT
jgi:hypothetical protein